MGDPFALSNHLELNEQCFFLCGERPCLGWFNNSQPSCGALHTLFVAVDSSSDSFSLFWQDNVSLPSLRAALVAKL